MGGCAAINCSNRWENNSRMFKFPNEEERRRKWIINCGREGWIPGRTAQLCNVHFEESQYEQHRADKLKKLKPNAVPTLFSPVVVFANKRIKGKGLSKPGSILDSAQVDHVEESQFELRRQDGWRKLKPNPIPTNARSSCEKPQSSQKENVLPNRRKAYPRKYKPDSTYVESDSEMEIEDSEEEEESEQDKLIASMRQEIQQFETHNKAMSRVILELEKHNKAMSFKLQELDKDNKVMSKKLQDLEKENEDLRVKLNCSFSEEQYSKIEKLMALGKIERYIPRFHSK